MVATLQSPNGTATGLVLRRRTERLVYPASADAYAEEGFDPERWNPDGAGFWAKVVASLTGMDERNELQLRLAFYRDTNDQTREDYFREIAWRVPEWGYATENDAGDVVPVPAPGEMVPEQRHENGANAAVFSERGHDLNWQAFDLLPYGVGAWLVERVRTIHLPPKARWIPAPPVLIGDSQTQTPSSQTTKPQES